MEIVILSKKAKTGNQSMIAWFVFLLFIIAGGIVAGVIFFLSSLNYDFREIDSEILNSKIISCLLNQQINLDSEIDFLEKCSMNKKSIEEHFLIIITLNNEPKLSIGKGDKTECSLGEKNNQYPKCTQSEVKIIYNNLEADLSILTGSNQQSRGILG